MILKYLPKINPSPIIVSQIAKMMIETLGAISPKVSFSIVTVAIWSAGLRPGKNFRKPNQKNMIPRLTRKKEIPLRRINNVILSSAR